MATAAAARSSSIADQGLLLLVDVTRELQEKTLRGGVKILLLNFCKLPAPAKAVLERRALQEAVTGGRWGGHGASSDRGGNTPPPAPGSPRAEPVYPCPGTDQPENLTRDKTTR